MVSVRTEYRQKRRQLIKECIMELCNMLDMNESELEAVPLWFFKNLKKSIQQRRVVVG